MKAKRIAIASVLKPVDDTRMYHKMGQSLAKEGYDVHIAGFTATNRNDKNIQLYPLFSFPRLSQKRLSAPKKIYQWWKSIQPDIIIITTHELMISAVLYKLFYKVKIIYDVRENYFLNIRLTSAFPNFLRLPLALYVRLKEQVFSFWINHFFLAEKGYEKELKFLNNRHTIIENKALPIDHLSTDKSDNFTPLNEGEIRLIFTGTIADYSGIFECIEMASKLHEISPEIRLTIAGYCQLPDTLKRIKNYTEKNDWITLVGGDKPVPHNAILSLIKNATAGFIYYTDPIITNNKIPTKLYEYLTYKLPILLQAKKEWLLVAQRYPAAVPVDHKNFDALQVLMRLKTMKFYQSSPGNETTWTSEAEQMLNIIKDI